MQRPQESEPDPLNLSIALLPGFLNVLENGWHQQVVTMVQERLPKFLFILFVLFLVQRIVQFFVNRTQRLAAHSHHPGRAAQLRTMAAILRATAYSILGFVALLQLLTLLNIDYAPLLASAGIVGVGVGLAAQSIFKDIINGVLILVEDQYNVGETVKLAGLQGVVEDLTLRLTRVRDGDGTLYTIPNSQIASVSNLSRDYAVASLPVSVDASANPDRVMALLGQIAENLRADPKFTPLILDTPAVLGVDKIDGRSILYPVNLRVRPLQKDPVLREFRRLIVEAFEREGIPLGTDGSLLVMQQKADPTAPPAQRSITAG